METVAGVEGRMDRERKERGIDAVSRLANVSKATVSKAMNNCGSMEQGVKNAVLEAARKLQYEPAQKERLRRAEAVIGVVMPAKPKYFWGEVIRGVRAADREAGDVGMVLSLFSDLSSERDALYCMDYMEDLRPDMLIVVPPPFFSVQERLRGLTEKLPVVSLVETGAFPELFYVGANYYKDGMRLARAGAGAVRRGPGIVHVHGLDMPMARTRDESFRRELGSLVPEARWLGSVDMGLLASTVAAAQLARTLSERFGGAFGTVYVSQGDVPQVCLALQKMRRLSSVAVLGYENPEKNAAYLENGTIAALVEQDAYRQGYLCMRAALDYWRTGAPPENRRLFVPSALVTGSRPGREG